MESGTDSRTGGCQSLTGPNRKDQILSVGPACTCILHPGMNASKASTSIATGGNKIDKRRVTKLRKSGSGQ